MRLTLATCLIIAAAIFLAACQRDPAADGSRDSGTATHPWELGDRSIASGLPEPVVQDPDHSYNADADVEAPTLRGPDFGDQDTLNPDWLPGLWIQVCVVSKEIMNLYPVEEMDVLQMQPDGKAVLSVISQDKLYGTYEGYWHKPAPGQLGMSLDNQPEVTFFCEMLGPDFLYTWDYNMQVGIWYARIKQDANPQITANLFDTSRGDLHFTSVVGRSYEGYCDAINRIDLRGMYTNGVLTMRWEDQKGNLGGFAAFLVDPEWNVLNGVWWIDDYEAAPFGGVWTGTRKTTATEADAPVEAE